MHRPLTDSFPLCYAWDPAFDQEKYASDVDAEGNPFVGNNDQTAEQKRDEYVRTKYVEAWLRCVEQLDYSEITKPNAKPVVFRCRPLTDDEARKLRRAAQGDIALLAQLSVRVALETVEGGDLPKIERSRDGEYPQFPALITVKWMNALGRWSMTCGRNLGDWIDDLGGLIADRSFRPSPRS